MSKPLPRYLYLLLNVTLRETDDSARWYSFTDSNTGLLRIARRDSWESSSTPVVAPFIACAPDLENIFHGCVCNFRYRRREWVWLWVTYLSLNFSTMAELKSRTVEVFSFGCHYLIPWRISVLLKQRNTLLKLQPLKVITYLTIHNVKLLLWDRTKDF